VRERERERFINVVKCHIMQLSGPESPVLNREHPKIL